MGLTSIDGLVSGLDTTTIVSQLMAIERLPVTRLTARMAASDAKATAWDQIGSKMAALRTALEAIDTSTDFKSFNASSSNTEVLTATAGPSAVSGPFTLTVHALARAQQLISTPFASSTAELNTGSTATTATISSGLANIGATMSLSGTVANGSHTITVSRAADNSLQASLDGGTAVAIAGNSVSFTVGTGTLQFDFAAETTVGTASVSVVNVAAHATVASFASAVSAAGGPARAQLVDLGNGAGTRLILSAAKPGTDNAIEVQWTDGTDRTGLTELQSAADADIEIPGLAEHAIRSSNTISDLVPGVTFNLAKADPTNPVTINVTQDVDGAVGKVKAFVEALNAVVSALKSNSSQDAATKKSGPLAANSTLRSLQSSLATATGTVLSSGTYTALSQIGVSITRDGTYTFDEPKLRTALGSDFDGATNAINSLVSPLLTWAKDNDAKTGTVLRAKDGAKSVSRGIQKQIDAYEDRLTITEARYRKQFTNLEAALGQLKSQSTWLSGQLASLPSFSQG